MITGSYVTSPGPVLHFETGVAFLTDRLNQEALSARHEAGTDGQTAGRERGKGQGA